MDVTVEENDDRAGARSLGFVPAFDGLRGLAVLLVIAYHFRLTIDPWTTRSLGSAPRSSHWFGDLVPSGGFLGVDIFFVLSGFLITALLLREHVSSGRISTLNFYRRRAFRLLPALFLFAGAHLVYAAATNVSSALERSAIISVLFYYFNWKLVFALDSVPPALAHLWSLSVEEQFYLIWPLLTVVLLGARRRLGVVVVTLVSGIAAIAIWRIVLAGNGPRAVVYFRTDARADSLLVGALVAHLWFHRRVLSPRILSGAAWCALAFLTVCVFRVDVTDRFLYNGGFTAIAIAVALILLAILESSWGPRRALSVRPLRAVGRVSYGLYLWNPLAFAIALHHMQHSSFATRATAAFGMITAATLFSWFVVERPCMRWKRRVEVKAQRR